MRKNIVSVITASVLVFILAACATTGTAAKRGKVSDGFVVVDGGTFQMGSNDVWIAKPEHTVTVSSFCICDHEVTQKEYLDVTGKNPSYYKGDDKPVGQISWYDAVEYCNVRSIKTGLTPCYTIKRGINNNSDQDTKKWTVTCNFAANGYRLPTEAEWEYAARGGKKSKGYKYSGSDNLGDVAWYNENSRFEVHDVKTKYPNELGLYDMNGNVSEWCWDWYEKYTSSIQNNPSGASSGSTRIVRGGGCMEAIFSCPVSFRNQYSSDFCNSTQGFRVVRSAQ